LIDAASLFRGHTGDIDNTAHAFNKSEAIISNSQLNAFRKQRYARSQGELGRAVFTPTVSLASSANMALRVIFHQSYVGTSRVG